MATRRARARERSTRLWLVRPRAVLTAVYAVRPMTTQPGTAATVSYRPIVGHSCCMDAALAAALVAAGSSLVASVAALVTAANVARTAKGSSLFPVGYLA